MKLNRSPLTHPSLSDASPARSLRTVPLSVPSRSIVSSAVDSCGPRRVWAVRVQRPLRSAAGGSVGRPASRFSYLRPSTNTILTFVFPSSRSPSVTVRFAILPGSTVPSRSATP